MDYLPICVDIAGQRCLVVGGGDIAARKARLLVRAGASVVIVATELGEAVMEIARDDDAVLFERAFEEADLDGARLVVAATDEPAANRAIAAAAELRGLWVNVVDDPGHCNFIMPAIIDRDPVLVAVSTGGRSPVLARLTRGRIEAMLPSRLGELAVLLGSYRDRVKARVSSVEGRRRFWEQVLDGPVAELAQQGRGDAAAEALDRALDAAGEGVPERTVFVVGVGSADPDYLTFRMLRFMQRAEIIAHGSDAPAAVLDLCRRDATRVRLTTRDADELARELTDLTTDGKRVCWLTLGDVAALVERLAKFDVQVIEA